MKKLLLCTLLLITTVTVAQDFEWQWARRGGGTKQSQNETGSSQAFDSEQIHDIVVDADNNYYYLAFMTQNNTEYEGEEVIVYNSDTSPSGNTDIVLLSTDCEGTLRWTQTIGGATGDFAYKIGLDDNGGLYVGANVRNISGPFPNTYLPPHFSQDDALPIVGANTGEPQEAYKTIALLKYNTDDGSLAWRVMPQGDVTSSLKDAQLHNLHVQPDGTIHALIGFLAGTHLNGQVVVPDTYTNSYKYHVVKFDAEGEVQEVLPLSLEGVLIHERTSFRYDPVLQRYYVGGMRNQGSSTPFIALSFNGVPFLTQSFILAFSNTGEELWRKEITSESQFKDNRIHDIEVDGDANVYMVGSYLSSPDWTVDMGTYQFPGNLAGNVMFVMKFNPEGSIQWIKIPTGFNTFSGTWTGIHLAYDLAFNGDEVAVATQVAEEIWDDVSIDRPDNHLSDPGLLRLNKETGQAIALNDIMTSPGSRDGLSAVAVDNDGNYIVGGYFYNDLFTLEDDGVETLTKVAGQQSYTDFFVAKLANSACGSGTAGVQEHGYNTIKIYPNPSQGLVTIDSQETLTQYTVVNLLGQILLSGALNASQGSISIENLSSGTYILNIHTADGKIMSHKVVKE